MASTQDTNVSGSRPRSRKSIAHFPTSELGSDKENPHSDRAASVETRKGNRKGRSKSVGPGGIIALQEDSGNRQKVTTGNNQRNEALAYECLGCRHTTI